MNVRVEPNRFLSVACEPDERIVFDRKETRYHLLRDSAARLWDEICEGGTFEVAANPEEEDPIALLAEAGLLGIGDDAVLADGITRRVWLRRTGKVSAAAVVLPLVASITTPRLVLGQTDPGGPSLEDEVDLDQVNTNSFSEPVETSSTQSESGRTPKSERSGTDKAPSSSGGGLSNEQTGNSDGDNGVRTRTRRRTGQTSTTSTTETSGERTRTRRGDR